MNMFSAFVEHADANSNDPSVVSICVLRFGYHTLIFTALIFLKMVHQEDLHDLSFAKLRRLLPKTLRLWEI